METATQTAEMVAYKKAMQMQELNPNASVIAGGSSESKLDEGTYNGTLVGGVRPFKTICVKTDKGEFILNLAKFNVNFGDKTLVQEGTLDLEEWENDILQGVSLSNQGVEIEAKVINGKMRNIISRA
tara:strand:+ start:95 stop:475 length:381 start_codon:yes stop_codon:yes gene_type:complete